MVMLIMSFSNVPKKKKKKKETTKIIFSCVRCHDSLFFVCVCVCVCVNLFYFSVSHAKKKLTIGFFSLNALFS